MKAFVGTWVAAACFVLVLSPPAQAAHKLTAKKAEAALKPAADQMTPQVQQKVAAVLPGATVSKTRVKCQVVKKGQRAECGIEYAIVGASTGETSCTEPARVKFRSKKSTELKISIAPALGCIFVVPLA